MSRPTPSYISVAVLLCIAALLSLSGPLWPASSSTTLDASRVKNDDSTRWSEWLYPEPLVRLRQLRDGDAETQGQEDAEVDLGGLEEEWQWARDVSIVYTWVNGSEAVYQKKRVKAGGTVGGERDRDTGDFRFSLRSLSKYMAWHRGDVYLISPTGHIPDWIDQSNPRFHWIDQDSLVPSEDQPTFNSNVVEQWFHLIPNITDHFIVLNDDYFFGRQIHPNDFFFLTEVVPGAGRTEVGLNLFLEGGWAANRKGDGNWPSSVRNSAKAIQNAYGTLRHFTPRTTKHAPFVYSKRAYEGVHSRFSEVLRNTSTHPFRSGDDVIFPLLHHSWVQQEGRRCCGIRHQIISDSSTFLSWKTSYKANAGAWNKLKTKKPFWNVNDAMADGQPEAIRAAVLDLVRRLELEFPERSEFELPSASSDWPELDVKSDGVGIDDGETFTSPEATNSRDRIVDLEDREEDETVPSLGSK